MQSNNPPSPPAFFDFRPPRFPDRTFDIREHAPRSAPSDDGEISGAVRCAIEACAAAGGGTVRIPAGRWRSAGPIHLRSRVRLHLERDAVVQFSARPSDYLPVVFTRWEGIECYNFSPLIYASGCEDVAITGAGTFDGNGQAWWHWKKLQQPAARQLYDAEHDGVPVDRRILGTEQAALRPQFFQPINCRNVLVEGVTFLNGPMWTIHPVYCSNVIVRHATVLTDTTGPNTDGLNPDSCDGVLVEHCRFSTGDDCLAINAGMNEDGWRVGRPCQNILVRHCRMEHGHGGIVIGSAMSGGVRNVWAHDCQFDGTHRGIRLKSMRGRGGFVENIRIENIAMRQIVGQAILVDLYYGSTTVAPRSDRPPVFRGIEIRNVRCDGAETAAQLRGLPDQPIESIVLRDCRATSKQGLVAENVVGLEMSGCDFRNG